MVVDLMTLNGPLLVSNEAIVTGGRLESFSFAEVGLPAFRIAPEPGVATVVLVVPAQCDGRSVRYPSFVWRSAATGATANRCR